jgi:hypothetical protein
MNVRVSVGGAGDSLEWNAMQYHCMSRRANWSKKLPRRSEVKSREETPKKAGRSIIPDAVQARPGLWHIEDFFMKKAGRWPGLPVVRAADLPGRPIGMSLAPLRCSTSDGCEISPVRASRQLESQSGAPLRGPQGKLGAPEFSWSPDEFPLMAQPRNCGDFAQRIDGAHHLLASDGLCMDSPEGVDDFLFGVDGHGQRHRRGQGGKSSLRVILVV